MTTKILDRRTLLYGLRRLHACESSVRWVKRNSKLTPGQLWRTCTDGDWLEWLRSVLGLPESQAIYEAERACWGAGTEDAIKAARRALANTVRKVVPWREVARAFKAKVGKPDKARLAAAADRGPGCDCSSCTANRATYGSCNCSVCEGR